MTSPAPMDQPFHEWTFTVLETQLDTYGHVNHATYLELYEQARWDLVTAHGYGLKKIHEIQIGPVILGANINYKRELRLRHKITIQTFPTEYRGKVGTIRQRMIDEQGNECSNIELTYGIFDMKTRKLIHPPAEWLSAVGIKND